MSKIAIDTKTKKKREEKKRKEKRRETRLLHESDRFKGKKKKKRKNATAGSIGTPKGTARMLKLYFGLLSVTVVPRWNKGIVRVTIATE